MKKSKIIFLALLACAFGVRAENTTADDATLVARGWSMLNGRTFGSLGEVRSVVPEVDSSGRVLWYVVKMTKGAAVVAPDDEIEPVIAVLPGSNGDIPAGSTLRVMLMRDLGSRLEALAGGGTPSLQTSGLTTSSATSSEQRAKWNRLKLEGKGLRLTTSAAGNPATIVRWLDGWSSANTSKDGQTLRFWNQTDSTAYFTNLRVFNLYTPGHSPCGCVATAGASVMHYFRVPSGNRISNGCTYNGNEQTLETKGGTYDWSLVDNLRLRNGSPMALSQAAADLLGRVAYDCGVGCGMDYGDDGSGSMTYNLMQSFRNVFGVVNAQLVTHSGAEFGYGADIGPENYPNIIYNQIRGGAPVVLGIEQHEVVACGYGIDADNTDYTYVFLGWGGEDDAWYALPTIETKATVGGDKYVSTFIDELITEIAPFDDKFVAVVGRLVDSDGEPVAGGILTMGDGVTQVVADENGYWGTRVSPNDPCYVTDSTGERHEYELGVAATATTGGARASGRLAEAMPDAMTIELLVPSVRVGGDDSRIFASLNSALNDVREGETVEILEPTVLRKPVEISVNCTIFATNAVAAEALVNVSAGSWLTVTNGVTVVMSNLVFNADAPFVSVAEDSTLGVGGVCEIGTVVTDGPKGILIVSPMDDNSVITVDCRNYRDEGDVFARSTLPFNLAEDYAYLLLNAYSTRLGGEAFEDGGEVLIRWSRDAPVPDAAAVGKTVIEEVERNYRSLQDIMDDVAASSGDVGIVMFASEEPIAYDKYLALGQRRVAISGDGEIRPVLKPSGKSGFGLLSGGELVISNLVFSGYADADNSDDVGFIFVDGGDLTLDSGAELYGITGSVNRCSGVIDLIAGTVTTKEGSRIEQCLARGGSSGNGNGGAIYVEGTYGGSRPCTLNLAGGVITNCHAASYGGGVFVYGINGYQAEVNVSGRQSVAGNSTDDKSRDDLCLSDVRARDGLRVVGNVKGRIGILYATRLGGEQPIDLGDAFAKDAIAGEVLEDTLYSFFCDATEDLMAAVSGDTLVWTRDMRNDLQCSAEDANAKLTDSKGAVTYWWHLSDALAMATDGCVVELLTGNDLLAGEVTVSGRVTLRTAASAGADPLKIYRRENASIIIPAGSELTVTDIELVGTDPTADGIVWSDNSFFYVDGGKLTLANAKVTDVYGEGSRAANAVTVCGGGLFVMEDGAEIARAFNTYRDSTRVKETEDGAGGGLLVDNATARLCGGSIVNCEAFKGGGVFACNHATVYVSGDATIQYDYIVGSPSSSGIEVSDNSNLILEGKLTGAISSRPGYNADTNLVATVSGGWKWNKADLTASAACFVSDVTGEPAVPVARGSSALIVWYSAIENGHYLNPRDGLVYDLVGELPVIEKSALPDLAGSSTAGEVYSALKGSALADTSVSEAINSSDDPVTSYRRFRAWALDVAGGIDAVVKSNNAMLSYSLGASALLADPQVDIVDITRTGADLQVRVVVLDGECPVQVAAENVATMFEATSDLSDWTKGSVRIVVDDPVVNADSSITFTVRPEATSGQVFIRLRY